MPVKPNEETQSEDNLNSDAMKNLECDLTLTDKLNKKLLSSLLERMNSGNQFDRFIPQNEEESSTSEEGFSS